MKISKYFFILLLITQLNFVCGTEKESKDLLSDNQCTARSKCSKPTESCGFIKRCLSSTFEMGSSLLSSENASFFKAWLRAPFKMGSFFPLADPAAKLMASGARVIKGKYVVELGAGTGVVTKEIVKFVPEEFLICVEQDDVMVGLLKRKFPKATIIHGDACKLETFLSEEQKSNISSVVSTIPFRIASASDKDKIIRAAFSVLEDGGNFVQVSNYYPSRNFSYKEYGLYSQYIGWDWGGWWFPSFSFSYSKKKVD